MTPFSLVNRQYGFGRNMPPISYNFTVEAEDNDIAMSLIVSMLRTSKRCLARLQMRRATSPLVFFVFAPPYF